MLHKGIIYLTPLQIECLNTNGTIFAEGRGYEEDKVYRTSEINISVSYSKHVLHKC